MFKKAAFPLVLFFTLAAAVTPLSHADTSPSGSSSTTTVTGTDPEPIDPGTAIQIILTMLQLA